MLTSNPDGPLTAQHDVLHRRECAEGVTDEVGIARGVDQVNLSAVPREVAEMAVDRDMPALFFIIDVEECSCRRRATPPRRSRRR